jgi:DNA-binding NarL/FixJ family response regulator
MDQIPLWKKGTGSVYSSGQDASDRRASRAFSGRISTMHIEPDIAWQKAVKTVISSLGIHNYSSHQTGRTGLKELVRSAPDLIIMDLNLYDIDGWELLARIRLQCPSTKLILLTYRADDRTLHMLDSQELCSLVWKTHCFDTHLRQAVKGFAAGVKFVPPDVARAQLSLKASPGAFFKILSDTEQRLLPMFAQMLPDQSISERLGIKPSTVKWHRKRILSRLGLHRSQELVEWIRERGFCGRVLHAPPGLIIDGSDVEKP